MATRQSPEAWAQQLGFAGLERQHGLPAGLLTNLVRQESGGNPNAGSHAGARGLFQFMPGTARQYGVNLDDTSPAGLQNAANRASALLEDLMDMFNGDVEKALAGYNAGPGRVRSAMRRAGPNGDWRQFLPQETKDYIRIVGRGLTPGSAQRVASGVEVSDADREAEEARRRRRLVDDAGMDREVVDAISTNEIVGQLFFALIRSFVESRVNAAQAGRSDTSERVATTTREDRVAEMGEPTVRRAEQIQAQSDAAQIGTAPLPGRETSRADLGTGLPTQGALPRVAASSTVRVPTPA